MFLKASSERLKFFTKKTIIFLKGLAIWQIMAIVVCSRLKMG